MPSRRSGQALGSLQGASEGMDGADVVLALRQAGEEIWAVGIDDTYST
jgi:hypothetical protein